MSQIIVITQNNDKVIFDEELDYIPIDKNVI